MNFEQLRSFRAVAEFGSFSRAGDARFLAQSTVSMQIGALERELGVQLFDRLGRRVVLTDAGEQLLPYAVHVIAQLEESRQVMAEIRNIDRGRLTVGASHTIGNYMAPELFGRFSARYPGVRIVLEIARTPRIAERVLDGSLDLALVEASVSSPELLVLPFLTDELVLIVPRDHPWTLKEEIDPQDLAQERNIVREPGSNNRRMVEERLKVHEVELHVALELGTPEAIIGAVRAGLGVAIVSRHAADMALSAGVVAEVSVRGLHVQRDLYVLLHSDKHIGRSLAAFLEIVGLDINALQRSHVRVQRTERKPTES